MSFNNLYSVNTWDVSNFKLSYNIDVIQDLSIKFSDPNDLSSTYEESIPVEPSTTPRKIAYLVAFFNVSETISTLNVYWNDNLILQRTPSMDLPYEMTVYKPNDTSVLTYSAIYNGETMNCVTLTNIQLYAGGGAQTLQEICYFKVGFEQADLDVAEAGTYSDTVYLVFSEN